MIEFFIFVFFKKIFLKTIYQPPLFKKIPKKTIFFLFTFPLKNSFKNNFQNHEVSLKLPRDEGIGPSKELLQVTYVRDV